MSRARPMPPEQRRAAIIAAARPLLDAHGIDFTTRQVAEAAGIAEGTIFRVFSTKQELVWAVVEDALDPTPTCARIAALPDADLDTVATGIVRELQQAISDISRLFASLHVAPPPPDQDRSPTPKPAHHPEHPPELARRRAEQLVDAVMDALRPHEFALRITLADAASLLRSLAFATSHPFLADGRVTDPEYIAAIALHGMAVPSYPSHPSDSPHPSDSSEPPDSDVIGFDSLPAPDSAPRSASASPHSAATPSPASPPALRPAG